MTHDTQKTIACQETADGRWIVRWSALDERPAIRIETDCDGIIESIQIGGEATSHRHALEALGDLPQPLLPYLDQGPRHGHLHVAIHNDLAWGFAGR